MSITRIAVAAWATTLCVGLIGCGAGGYDSNPAETDSAPSDDAPSGEAPAESDAAAEQEMNDQPADIVDTAVAAGDFTTLAAALKAADLIDTLKGPGPFTVFAPTDAAFSQLPEGTVESLLKPENKDQLVAVLTYHVVSGKVDSAAVSDLSSAKTVNGADVTVNADADGVRINSANVVTADIACSNGIIHVVDAVLLPPTDSAADKLHGGEPTAIEGVGSFETLFAAIDAAGLGRTLKEKGPFTIFAPTDEAFAALPEGTLESLLKPENKDQLTAILTHHVVAGNVPSTEVVKLDSAETLNGTKLPVNVSEDGVRVGDANVLKTDVDCEVGLIHAIDKVLLP